MSEFTPINVPNPRGDYVPFLDRPRHLQLDLSDEDDAGIVRGLVLMGCVSSGELDPRDELDAVVMSRLAGLGTEGLRDG